MPKPLFPLGRIVSTPGALALLDSIGLSPSTLLDRHNSGDWGDLDDEDKTTNDEAVKHGDRILSAYETDGGKIWIITEWDRSVTTVLLPSEY